MSFKSIEDAVSSITQGFFGETVIYKRDATQISIPAVFKQDWVESNGVSTYELTARILLSDISSLTAPQKGDLITRSSKTYTIRVAQPDSFGGFTLILGE